MKPGVLMQIPGGLKVRRTQMLPIEIEYPACNLETGEIVKIKSGDYRHMVEMDGVIFVSEEVYSKLAENFCENRAKV